MAGQSRGTHADITQSWDTTIMQTRLRFSTSAAACRDTSSSCGEEEHRGVFQHLGLYPVVERRDHILEQTSTNDRQRLWNGSRRDRTSLLTTQRQRHAAFSLQAVVCTYKTTLSCLLSRANCIGVEHVPPPPPPFGFLRISAAFLTEETESIAPLQPVASHKS